jgi:hypothetical protein
VKNGTGSSSAVQRFGFPKILRESQCWQHVQWRSSSGSLVLKQRVNQDIFFLRTSLTPRLRCTNRNIALVSDRSLLNLQFNRYWKWKRSGKLPGLWIQPELSEKEKVMERLTQENAEFLQTLNAENQSPLKSPPPERSPFTFRFGFFSTRLIE